MMADPIPFNETKSPRIVLWKLTRAEIEHENSLVRQRTTSLLASQAVLLAAFGSIAWGYLEVPASSHCAKVHLAVVCIATFAGYLCFCFHDGIDRASRQLRLLGREYANAAEKLPPCIVPVPSLQHDDQAKRVDLGSERSIAAASLVVWIAVILVSMALECEALPSTTDLIVAFAHLVALTFLGTLVYRRWRLMKQRDLLERGLSGAE